MKLELWTGMNGQRVRRLVVSCRLQRKLKLSNVLLRGKKKESRSSKLRMKEEKIVRQYTQSGILRLVLWGFFCGGGGWEVPGGSVGKEICLQCGRLRFDSWVVKIPWRREWQPPPVFLPGEFHGQRNLVGYSPCGHKELDMTE